MGTTNHTPNFNLSQYSSGEKVKFLTNYNNDMAAIDAELKNSKDHRENTNNPHGVTAAQVGAINSNLLINCDFRNPINQRGKSSYHDSYSVDRWLVIGVPNENLLTVNSGYVTLSCSDVKSGNTIFTQRLEEYERGVNPLTGQTLTARIRYRAACSITAFYAYIVNNGVGENIGYTSLVSDGQWHDATITYVVPTGSTITRFEPAGVGLGAVGSVDIAYIKCEVGSVPTPFSPRPYAEELAMCQRYYQVLDFECAGVAINATEALVYMPFSPIMRNNPTYKLPNGNGIYCNGSISVLVSSAVAARSSNILALRITTNGGLTVNHPVFCTSSSAVFMDAEIY